MSCEIFTKNLLRDADKSSMSIADYADTLRNNLMEPYQDSISGLWLPIVITPSDSSIDHCELLAQPFAENVKKFNPCECSDEQIFGLEISDLEEFPDLSLECEYCNTCDDPCGEDTTCEVRMNNDDWTPKIRYLHQGYITGFYDFKNLKQFPACSNVGLGFEKFIKMDSQTFTDPYADTIYIDWKLQETISEIKYDAYASRHTNEYTHNKSYLKSLRRSETCGNFFFLGDAEDDIVLPDTVVNPYGFTNQTYDNIYVGERHLGSHWKWNYQSGIMGWYRHFDISRENDTRPLAGIDLYIPPGDIFYATNHGPELDRDEESETSCPQGLKIVDGTELVEIIPNGSDFVYISTNMYEKFINIRKRIEDTSVELSLKQQLLLTTHPEYDNIVTDLLDDAISENRNDLGQLTLHNQYMTSGTKFQSAFDLYYCETNEILINTLSHKYGAYMLIEQESYATLTLPTTIGTSDAFYIDIDFDMVIPKDKRSFSNANGGMLPNVDVDTFNRKFVYNQNISLDSTQLVNTSYSNQTIENNNYSTLYFYGQEVANAFNNSGSYHFEDQYPDDETLRRRYPAGVFNPHVDLIAVHQQGGIHVNAMPFNLNGETFFLKGTTKATGPDIKISFNTENCAIKIYDMKVKKLQSSSNSSKSCDRFPYTNENSCKCYGFGTGGTGLPVTQDTTVYQSNKFLPGLSTKNSPSIKLKGGYNQSYLDKLFGENVATAGGNLVSLSNKNDHPRKEDCNREASINLVNYVNSDYTIDVVNENINTKYLITATEGVQLSANRFIGDPEDGVDNMNWKRFTTKSTINSNQVLYDEHQAIMQNASNSFDIHLTNPFLAKLINDTTNNYYPPHWFPDFWNRPGYSPCDVASRVYSKRGDESSVVRLTFKEYHPKKLFNFWIPPPKSYGTLSRGEFHPNDGLKSGNGTNNFIKNDKPYYECSIDNNQFEQNKGVLYGNITEPLKKLASNVSEFEIDKKLKLYIKVGSLWYSIDTPKINSYSLGDKKYIGRPKFFEYVQNRRDSINIPMIMPLSAKQLQTWSFFLNGANLSTDSVLTGLSETYPFINGRQVTFVNNNELVLSGSRYYFMLEEEFKIIQPVGPDGPIDKIGNIDEVTNTYNPHTIVNLGGDYYFYKGADHADPQNYIYLGPGFKDILGLKNSTYLNFALDINNHGSIYGTEKRVNQNITIFINRKGIIFPRQAKVVKKELKAIPYGDDNLIDYDDPQKHDLKTILTLDTNLNLNNAEIYGIKIADDNSFCIYQNNNSTDSSEYIRNEYIRTKWQDVIDFDEIFDLLVQNDTDINLKHPSSEYENVFVKQMINNNNSEFLFNITIDGQSKNIISSKVYHNILQKYNLHVEPLRVNLRSSSSYVNFIPMMDINILDADISDIMPDTNEDKRDIGIPITGFIKSPNLLTENDTYDIAPNNHLIINVETEDQIRGCYVPIGGIYSETLRLDDPYFSLANTTKTTSAADFKASASTFSQNRGTIKRDYPFAIFNNYDDNDTGGGLESTDTEEEASAQTISTIIDTLIPGGLPYVTSPLPDPVVTPPASRQDGCSEQDSTTCSLSVNGSTSLYASLYTHNIFNSTVNLPNNDVEYFCTYEAGIYNALSQSNLVEIYKSVLPADNPLHSAYDFCNTSYLRPDFKRTFHDDEAQKTIEDNIVDTLNNTDKYANEMLFRILYGEKDKINRKMLNSDYEPLTAEDLVNYADPKVKAIDIYDEILYNYDTNADFNDFYINGSFTLNTPVAIGKNFNINVDGKVIDFIIVRNGGAIQADGTIDGDSFLATIYNEYTVATSMAVTDTDVTLNNTANTTYTYKATSQQDIGYKYYGWARRIYTGQCIGVYNPWGKEILRHGVSFYTCGVIGSNVIYDDVSITNCAGERCQGRANVYLERTTTTDDEATEGDPVAPIAENFSYTFKKCRTNFTLDGYRLAKGAGPCDVSFGYCNIDTGACGEYTPYDYPDAEVTTTPHNRNLIEYWDPPGPRPPELRYKDIDGLPINRGEVWQWQCSGRNCNATLWSSNLAGRHPPRILNPCPSPGYNKGAEEEWENPANLVNGRTFPANLKDPCQDAGKAGNNFETGDPGYDQCGYSYRTSVIPAKKYWLARTTTHNDPWDEEAIVALFTVKYNNREISITIGDVYRCLDASIDDCPSMSVSVPKNGYITESIDSGCDRCSEVPLKLSLSTDNSYQTVKETKRMTIASMAGTDVNPQYLVQTFSGSDGALDGAGYTNNQTYAICGMEGMMWLSNETDSYGNNARGRALFVSSMTNAFNNVNQEVGAQYNIGGSWNTSSVTNAKRICNGSNSKIPEADIISGPVPNSCGGLQFETTTRTYTKYRASQDGQTIEESTGTHYTVTAYIEYDYIRPVSVYDKVKEILGVTCSVDYNEQDIYPDWYGSVVGVPNIFYTSVPNFVGREPIFFNSCGGSTDCYYKGADDDSCDIYYAGDCVDKAPAPCADEDWICWSTNNSAWLKLRY